jgi:phenylpropionate dioxygenase-like ring-hydroxylating dioxygenase large terminal subunit
MMLRSPDEGLRDRLVREINLRFNAEVMDEDVVLCDGVQEGLGSLTYERGVLNDSENAVRHFHDLLREAVPGIDDPA